jgi:hypothetical protein
MVSGRSGTGLSRMRRPVAPHAGQQAVRADHEVHGPHGRQRIAEHRRVERAEIQPDPGGLPVDGLPQWRPDHPHPHVGGGDHELPGRAGLVEDRVAVEHRVDRPHRPLDLRNQAAGERGEDQFVPLALQQLVVEVAAQPGQGPGSPASDDTNFSVAWGSAGSVSYDG